MAPRFAQVIDHAATLAAAKKRFPSFAIDLQHAANLSNEREMIKAARINSKIARQQPLTKEDVNGAQHILEPGVYYRQDWIEDKINPGTMANGLPNGKLVEFIKYDRVPMGDWDWPDPSHTAAGQTTIHHLGDVYDRLAAFTQENPLSKWQTYLTPGGVRAFEVGRQLTPKQFQAAGYFDKLQVDPYYKKLAIYQANPANDPKYDPIYPTQGWAARITGKPGRTEDFVAFPLGTVGTGFVNPKSRYLLDTYHDMPIMRSMVNDGMEPYKLPPTGLALLEKHLATVPRNYAAPIEQRLSAMGVIPQ